MGSTCILGKRANYQRINGGDKMRHLRKLLGYYQEVRCVQRLDPALPGPSGELRKAIHQQMRMGVRTQLNSVRDLVWIEIRRQRYD